MTYIRYIYIYKININDKNTLQIIFVKEGKIKSASFYI